MVKVSFTRKKGLGPLCQANEFASSFMGNMIWHTLAEELARQQIELDEALAEDPENEQLLREEFLLKDSWNRLMEEFVYEA